MKKNSKNPIYKSCMLDIATDQVEVIPTQDLTYSPSNTLTFLRGQSFFTSAFTITNKYGSFLLVIESHYERLLRSYRQLFERTDFPISYERFKECVNQAISLNKHHTTESIHCIIALLPGKGRVYEDPTGAYANGFGGHLETMMIMVKPYQDKPEWGYESGINVVSMPFQRPLAAAKPANYWGGIKGQHLIDSINTLVLLSYLKKTPKDPSWFDNECSHWISEYNELNDVEKYQWRLCLNDCRFGAIHEHASLTQSALRTHYGTIIDKVWPLIDSVVGDRTLSKRLQDLESSHFPKLIHESIFTTPDKQILEGSTFSLMGINQQNEWVFIPLEGNAKQEPLSDPLNDGNVLESTCIAFFQTVSHHYDIPFKVESVSLDELSKFKAVLIISSTRIKVSDTTIMCQPCRSINGTVLPTLPLNTIPLYTRLMSSAADFVSNYEYDKLAIYPKTILVQD